MGQRKKIAADARKAARKQVAMAQLRNCPTSPRKMRLMADLVRGMEVSKALYVLKHSSKEASERLEKLLLSALSNWQAKNEGVDIESANLVIERIEVGPGRMLKRIQPAPQGRAHRIRKRSNHVTMVVGASKSNEVKDAE